MKKVIYTFCLFMFFFFLIGCEKAVPSLLFLEEDSHYANIKVYESVKTLRGVPYASSSLRIADLIYDEHFACNTILHCDGIIYIAKKNNICDMNTILATTYVNPKKYKCYFDRGRFRPIFYELPAPFIYLVCINEATVWFFSRSCYERKNINIAVSFVKYFNISREDFKKANVQLQQIWERIDMSAQISSLFEFYPVDLIFSFDNERINRYFLWENSPVAVEFGIGMEIGKHRPLFYNMPAPFVNLVGREVFIEWRHARSQEERENESIAVSFIRYFGISRYEFERANEEMRQIWEAAGVSAADSSIHELYPVDLIFTFDNELINEFFLWENSSVPAETTNG